MSMVDLAYGLAPGLRSCSASVSQGLIQRQPSNAEAGWFSTSPGYGMSMPIGYQSNLLVMGPGHSRLRNFPTVGLPLVFILWATLSPFVPWSASVP
jgi:hypothetical protein